MPGSFLTGAWVLLAAAVLALDYLTGPHIRFSILFPLPVALAAWFSGKWVGGAFAVALPLGRLAMLQLFLGHRLGDFDDWANAAIGIGGLLLLVIPIELKRQRDTLEREVNVLRGLLPICSFCKKIRNTQNAWEPLETYITTRSEAEFTHGLCPPCAKEHYKVDVTGG